MKAEQLKVLLIVPPNRTDFYGYLQHSKEMEIYILFYVNKSESFKADLPGFIAGEYFWSDYKTPVELLNQIKPSRIIFFEIIDQRQISLIVTAKHFRYPTFYLEHGAAGDKDTAIQRSETHKVRYLVLQRIPYFLRRIFSSFREILAVKRFYLFSARFLSGKSLKNYLLIPILTLIFKPNKALMLCKFPERVPLKCILFNVSNWEEFYLYTGAEMESVSIDGVPLFDEFYSDRINDSGPIVYIEHPMLEEGLCGWTAEHHKMIARSLRKLSEDRKEKIFIKLHPRSSMALWESYSLTSAYFEILQFGNHTQLFLDSKLILSFASSLVNGLLCAKKNIVLLGWHPKPQIFGFDFSQSGMCHLSMSVDDLQVKFDDWLNLNLAATNPTLYDKFIRGFNYPFDGDAKQRVIRTITNEIF